MDNLELERAAELIRQEIAELDKRQEALESELQQWIMYANKTQGHIQENRQLRDRLEALLATMLNSPPPNEGKQEKETIAEK